VIESGAFEPIQVHQIPILWAHNAAEPIGRLESLKQRGQELLAHGTLRALAIMAPARSKVLPAVPTTAEVGYPKLLGSIWIGLYTTAGTPQDVIGRLNRELVRIVDSAMFRHRVEAVGYEARPMDVDTFRKCNLDETVRWGEIIRANGIRLE
jgi:tripartite-type tricarboxylate transporter receptor subunit TctC